MPCVFACVRKWGKKKEGRFFSSKWRRSHLYAVSNWSQVLVVSAAGRVKSPARPWKKKQILNNDFEKKNRNFKRILPKLENKNQRCQENKATPGGIFFSLKSRKKISAKLSNYVKNRCLTKKENQVKDKEKKKNWKKRKDAPEAFFVAHLHIRRQHLRCRSHHRNAQTPQKYHRSSFTEFYRVFFFNASDAPLFGFSSDVEPDPVVPSFTGFPRFGFRLEICFLFYRFSRSYRMNWT